MIRQQLVYLNQKKITLVSEERDSIIGFYQSYYKLLNYIMNFSIDTISEKDSLEFIRVKSTINTLQMELDCSLGRLELFYNSIEFINSVEELLVKTINLKEILLIYLINYGLEAESLNILKQSPHLKDYEENIQTRSKAKFELSKHFIDDRLEAYKEIINNIIQVRDILKNRIYVILTE
ncbi:MAG: hypothetical protein IPN08_18000 [Bacteroidales bacterium]|nr:hypothetical protein [Bacteroidales bacterium]